MKKFKLLFCIIIIMMLVLVGCTTRNESDNDESRGNYEYSDYELDNKAAQYYMNKNAVAAEDGYYYIAYAPLSNSNNRYIYYFDLAKMKSYPLCSKLECEHTTSECEAYLSEEMCANYTIWYYDGRIYMIETSQDHDLLVSYNHKWRDRQTEAILNVDGMSVVNSGLECWCINQGKFYYFLRNEKTHYLYVLSLEGDTQPKMVKEYTSDKGIAEFFSLYAIGGNVYINWYSAIDTQEFNYLVDGLLVKEDSIERLFDYNNSGVEVRGRIDEWNRDIYFDEDGNMYFASIDKDEYIVNKLNLKMKNCEELFVMKSENVVEKDTQGGFGVASDTNYMAIKGFDGTRIYVSRNVNPGFEKERETSKNNYLYAVDVNGGLIDTIVICRTQNNNSKGSNNVQYELLGVDGRYMLLSTSTADVKGLEMSESEYKKYLELQPKNSNSPLVYVERVGAINIKEISTGNHNITDITFRHTTGSY